MSPPLKFKIMQWSVVKVWEPAEGGRGGAELVRSSPGSGRKMTHHHDHALTTTASGDLIGEAGLLEFLILLCFMTSGNLWTQQSMDTALVLVILARDPWQLSLYTTASWRAEPHPTNWAAFTLWRGAWWRWYQPPGQRWEKGKSNKQQTKQQQDSRGFFWIYWNVMCW